MQKTTAKVEHRDYVPFGWIAVTFCHVDFYGYRAGEMKKKWSDIKHQRFRKYDSLFKENKTKIKNLRSKANAIRSQVEKSKPFYRFWYNKEEKEMLSEADELSRQAYELANKNNEVEEKKFFSTYECHKRIEELLEQNGFVLTSTSSSGDECVTDTEIWTLEE